MLIKYYYNGSSQVRDLVDNQSHYTDISSICKSICASSARSKSWDATYLLNILNTNNYPILILEIPLFTK
jgi:hypothetical protein